MYVNAIKSIRLIDDKPWLFQKDGNLFYGMRKAGLTQEYKDVNNIQNLVYFTQSLDLNPIKGIWAIIKQCLRHKIFDSEKEMKKALQEE
jgi:hypothetical protein